MPNLKQLRQQEHDLRTEGLAVLAAIEKEERDPTEAEDKRLTELQTELAEVREAIAKQEQRRDQAMAFERVGDPPPDDSGNGVPRIAQDPKRGFASFGDFAAAVYRSSRPGGAQDERFVRLGMAPTTFASEGVGADGGFLVPPEFGGRIMELSLDEESLLALSDNDDVQGNSMVWPRDEETPWTSAGVRAFWEAEAAQATQTKPVIGTFTQRLHKLFALVPTTDELLADTTALSGFLERKTAMSIRYKTNDAIINGNGAGQPLGILNAGSLVSQAKEGSQVADTIVAENVVKMFARNLNPGSAVWIVNPDAWHQLPLMTIGDQPIWISPSGLQQAPGGVLLGRPVLMMEQAQTVGDLGDIYFANFRMGYKSITKAGGVQTATSMHLWFDYDVMAFRAIFRVDGQPWLQNAVTPPNSSITRSHFVALAART